MEFEQINAPPCVKIGEELNYCARIRFAEQVLNHVALFNEWQGWKFKGRDLVSPDGLRINPERLRGFLFREKIDRLRHEAAVAQQSTHFGKSPKSAQIIELKKK